MYIDVLPYNVISLINNLKIIVFQRDSSKLSCESFRDDVSIQNWSYSHNNANDSFTDLYTKLEASVDMLH